MTARTATRRAKAKVKPEIPRVELSQVGQALEAIRKANGGILRPQDVVDWAADPKHVLHDRFDWDDTSAAAKYRLWQARQLISFTVCYAEGGLQEQRYYVSLRTDRNGKEGYRSVLEVMEKPTLQKQLMEDALAELEHFQQKYQKIQSLAKLFKSPHWSKVMSHLKIALASGGD